MAGWGTGLGVSPTEAKSKEIQLIITTLRGSGSQRGAQEESELTEDNTDAREVGENS